MNFLLPLIIFILIFFNAKAEKVCERCEEIRAKNKEKEKDHVGYYDEYLKNKDTKSESKGNSETASKPG